MEKRNDPFRVGLASFRGYRVGAGTISRSSRHLASDRNGIPESRRYACAKGPARRKVDSGGSAQRQNPVSRRRPQIGGSELQRTRNVRSSPLLFPAGSPTGRAVTGTIPNFSEFGSRRNRLSACSRVPRDL